MSVSSRLDLEWAGPLADVTGLPGDVLVGVVLTAVHAASFVPWESVRRALRTVLRTAPRERRLLVRGVEMEWPHGRIPLTARVHRSRVTLRSHARVTPTQLSHLLAALASVPHLRDLRLRGSIWSPPSAGSRSRPDWMDTPQRFR